MKYYVLINRSPQKGQSGESCGSHYDLRNACKKCGTGAQLDGKLYVRGLNNVKESLVSTFDGDVLVSTELYTTLVTIGNLDLFPVFDQKENQLRFYHLSSKFSFPRMLPQSQGLKVEDQCEVCKKNGYFNDVIIGDIEKGIKTYIAPFVFHYEIDKVLLNQSDIFHTWEHIGLSNLKSEGNKVIRYARPLLIVSERVKEILETFKLKKVSFSEVIIHLLSTED
jgi:hypothetical protein